MAPFKRYFDAKPYDGPLKSKLASTFGDFSERVEISDEKYILTPGYYPYQRKFADFETKPSDVWVVTYPKSGTTWTQEMVWCILKGLDSEEVDEELMKRFPCFEWDDSLLPPNASSMDGFKDGDPWTPGETWKILENGKEPRTIKSHLHLEMLPADIISSGAKIIYVCRDPRDVCVSYYYFMIKFVGYSGSFQDYFDLFIADLHLWSPYWKHVIDYWNRRDDPNLLFIRYEEMKEDLSKVIRKVAHFLEKNLSDECIDNLIRHLSFSSMSTNTAVNFDNVPCFGPTKSKLPFMRKGKVGDWKAHFSAENIKVFKKWREEKLSGVDFPYYQNYD